MGEERPANGQLLVGLKKPEQCAAKLRGNGEGEMVHRLKWFVDSKEENILVSMNSIDYVNHGPHY